MATTTTTMMMIKMVILLCVTVGLPVFTLASGQPEMIANGGFESTVTRDQWRCVGCSLNVESSDAHGGRSALHVMSRQNSKSGPGQYVHVQGGARYRVQAYVKQLNDVASSLFQDHTLRFTIKYSGHHNPHQEGRKIAERTMMRSSDGWFSMIGFVVMPDGPISSAELRHMGPAPDVHYLIDDVSVTLIPEDTDWRRHADQQIDTHRKGNIHVGFHLPSSIHSTDVSVELLLKKHQFGFGTLVKDDYIIDPHYQRYQDITYSLFNVATQQSFKWKFDKGTQNHPDYTRTISAMQALRAHGLKVRAHNMFWGFTKNMPEWVPHLSLQQLNATIQSRLQYMVGITKGKVVHWDVMNELLHGQWFEDTFQDPLFSQRVFSQIKALDHHPTLMLNDFHVISLPDATDAYLRQAQQYLANGVPLEGLGIQSHFKDFEDPDPTVIKDRLDHLSQCGLPLWITEMNFFEDDVHRRADLYETAYRVYFSHPAVQGIVLWGFWDQQGGGPSAALVDGSNYQFNEAGKRVARLLQEEWRTHVTQTLTSGSSSVNVRGFKGDYDVIVRVKGVPVKVMTLSLAGSDVTVSVRLTGHEGAVSLPPPVSTVLPPSSPPPPAEDDEEEEEEEDDKEEGEGDGVTPSKATSSSSSLHCTARVSSLAGNEDLDLQEKDHAPRVTCREGEVMTACSSVRVKGKGEEEQNRKQLRAGDGEMEKVQGQTTCTAAEGHGSSRNVHAVAVCCAVPSE